MIHPTAIIDHSAELGVDVEVGPYCVIGAAVQIGDGCRLLSHVSIQGPVTIGPENIFHPFTVIGARTQDLKYTAEPTFLSIGAGNNFREFTTVHRATAPGNYTRIGNNNNFLAYSHVAHDCIVGDGCIFSNNGTLAGHVTVDDYSIISGLSAVHQHCRLGTLSFVGGCTKIVQDVPPYFIADGNPAAMRAVNVVGLQRHGYTAEQITDIRNAYRILYDKTLNTTQAVDKLEAEYPDTEHIRVLIAFVRTSARGIIR
ncbi:acyl-[acyl-carrier-protein]--UDP-N-acetylglucosamine O-acyltransferase [Verrucomicrobia bacterium LW23]|nr:acyl-[acyl-carrier-protein]--UDP-N-acetylglucosamine O-acyltransferase [Verrucomicrobia bacterium LW23]